MKESKIKILSDTLGLTLPGLAEATGITSRTINRYHISLQEEGPDAIKTWKVENIIKLAHVAQKSPGEFFDWILNVDKYNGLLVNEEDQTIQGVHIQDRLVFNDLLEALLTNSNMGYIPTPNDVKEILKNWKNIPKSTLEEVRQKYIHAVTYTLAQSRLKTKE